MSRTVFAEETEHDKDLYTLAYTKASCCIKQCPDNCNSCPTYKDWVACYRALPACDRLRVDNMCNELIAKVNIADELMHGKKRDGQIRALTKIIRSVIIALVITVTLYVIGAAVPLLLVHRPRQAPDIMICIRDVKSRLPGYGKMDDINRDGLSDCIDCALGFKIIWDSLYRYPCEIVRNKNPNGMHHLFCRVQDKDGTWYYVEPNSDFIIFDMTDIWGTDYNPDYNIYGESYRWMKEVVYGKCKN